MTMIELCGLNPAHNMIPKGALTLGVPDEDAALCFTDSDVPVFCKSNIILGYIIDAFKTGMIRNKSVPMIVVIIQKDTHVTCRVYTTGDMERLDSWEMMCSLDTLSEDPEMLSRLIKDIGSENIALFIETEEGSVVPISNAMVIETES